MLRLFWTEWKWKYNLSKYVGCTDGGAEKFVTPNMHMIEEDLKPNVGFHPRILGKEEQYKPK